MSMCRVFSCVVGRGCLLWPVLSLDTTLLTLLHSVFQGQICLLLQEFLDFLLLHSPIMKRMSVLGVSSKRSCRSSKNRSTLALDSITMNKASGGDRIPVELFQICKDDAVKKCCTQYASKFEKLSSGHRTGKGQFSSQFQRKAMLKNAQTTAQLHSSHMLVK